MKLPTVLSQKFLQAMPEEERRRLGKAGITQAEAEAKYAAGQERKLQDMIANYLTLKGFWFCHSRTDKRTTQRRGVPDFVICAYSLFLACEVKCTGQTLTQEQAREANKIRASGGAFVIAYSLQDLVSAIQDLDAL